MKFEFYVFVSDPFALSDLFTVKGFVSQVEAERYMKEQKYWLSKQALVQSNRRINMDAIEWYMLSRDDAIADDDFRPLVEDFEGYYAN